MLNSLTLPSPKPREPGSPWSLVDAGRFLGVSAKTLDRRAKDGAIRVIRYGRLVRIPDEEVRRLATSGF